MSLLLLFSGASGDVVVATATASVVHVAPLPLLKVRPTIGVSDFLVDESNAAILDDNNQPILGFLSNGPRARINTATLKIRARS